MLCFRCFPAFYRAVVSTQLFWIGALAISSIEKKYSLPKKIYRSKRRFLLKIVFSSFSCKKASKPESVASASPSLRFSRPPHFKPFSHGKRSCMGYKLVENVCTVLTVAVVSHFRLDHGEKRNRLPAGLLGLPQEPVKMRLSLREGC